jgi:N-acetylglucosamine kinase
LHAFYTTAWPRSRIAALASIVDSAAAEGDLIANEILSEAAEQLAGFALAVRDQLWAAAQPVNFSFIGGVFQSEPIRRAFKLQVESRCGCKVSTPLFNAACGALLEAYRRADVSPDLDKLLTSNF